MDFAPIYNVYLDGGDFNVSTSKHIKETIQGSDAHQVFNASPTSVLLDTKFAYIHMLIWMMN